LGWLERTSGVRMSVSIRHSAWCTCDMQQQQQRQHQG
jgi:hypothetical protein